MIVRNHIYMYIKQKNKKKKKKKKTSTIIYVSCNNCKKPILSSKNGYWFCDDCKKLTNKCSIW